MWGGGKKMCSKDVKQTFENYNICTEYITNG